MNFIELHPIKQFIILGLMPFIITFLIVGFIGLLYFIFKDKRIKEV